MKQPKSDLLNKYCLITGSGGLLGYEHALALLEINSNVILTDINLPKLKNIKAKLDKLYPKLRILIYKMDVSKEKSILKVVKNLKKNKIIFAGIDLIGNYLTGDINITSPTGIKNFMDLTGKNLAIDYWNFLEKKN